MIDPLDARVNSLIRETEGSGEIPDPSVSFTPRFFLVVALLTNENHFSQQVFIMLCRFLSADKAFTAAIPANIRIAIAHSICHRRFLPAPSARFMNCVFEIQQQQHNDRRQKNQTKFSPRSSFLFRCRLSFGGFLRRSTVWANSFAIQRSAAFTAIFHAHFPFSTMPFLSSLYHHPKNDDLHGSTYHF